MRNNDDFFRLLNGRCGVGRCADCLFWDPFIRHALASAPFGVAHSRPLAVTSLRSCAHSFRSLRGSPPKRCAFLRRIWRPIKQASPSPLPSLHVFPLLGSPFRSNAGNGILRGIGDCGSVTHYLKILRKIFMPHWQYGVEERFALCLTK